MKTKLMAMLLMAGGAMFAETHVAIGVQFGRPAYGPAPVYAGAYRPPCPGPGYVWIDGYYDAYGNWYDGYWALPPYGGAYWVAPRFAGGRFFGGYWGGPRGYMRVEPRGHEFREREFRGGQGFRGGFRGEGFRGHEGRESRGRGGDFGRGHRR